MREGLPSRNTTHEATGLVPLQVGVVEAFDVAGRTVQVQLFLHGGHQAFGMPFGILDFEVLELLGAVDTGALERELQQVEFFAPFGDGEGHPVEKLRGRGEVGDDDLFGQRPGDRFGDVLNGQGQHLRRIGVDTRGEPYRVNSHDRTVTDTQEIAVGHVVVHQQGENVHVHDAGTDDYRLARIVIQRVEACLVALRDLEFQVPGSRLHLFFEVCPHGSQVAFENRDRHIDQCVVFFLALCSYAGTFAVAQVVLQAYRVTSFGDSRRRKVERAGTQGYHLADKFQDTMLHHHRSVRPEILGAVAVEDTRGLYAGERLAAHDDPGIGLVVLEQDVVARLEGFDQRVFEQQGVRFGINDDVPDRGDLPHEYLYLGAVLLVLYEIRADPLAQAFGFTDVDDRPVLVQKLIYAR